MKEDLGWLSMEFSMWKKDQTEKCGNSMFFLFGNFLDVLRVGKIRSEKTEPIPKKWEIPDFFLFLKCLCYYQGWNLSNECCLDIASGKLYCLVFPLFIHSLDSLILISFGILLQNILMLRPPNLEL